MQLANRFLKKVPEFFDRNPFYDLNITLKFSKKIITFLFVGLSPGVDFIKVGRKAQFIEIALSKLGARRKARPTPLKSFSKVGRRAQNSL